MFSVVILTLNEEKNLPACLGSLGSLDDIHVLDSGSTDRTATIAGDAGARVYTRAFDNFAGQRNHAHEHIPFRYPWVFHLDADEQFTPELAEECRAASRRDDLDGFLVAPRMLWEGHWVRRSTDYPAYQARFAHVRRFRFIEVGHGQREAPGLRLGRLRQNYLHEMAASGEVAWLEKHRRYARAEALAHHGRSAAPSWRDLWSGSALARRRALKHLSYGLPFRPLLRFVYQYGLRGGFLDGAAGYTYCRLLARYEGFAAAELKRLRAGQP